MVRWISGLGLLVCWALSAGACGGVVETDGAAGSAGSPGSPQQYACGICSNAKLSCVVNGSTDTLVRSKTSQTGCAFDFGSSSFSVECSAQNFCIEGFGCSKYTASGNTFTVNSSLGRVSCAPAKT